MNGLISTDLDRLRSQYVTLISHKRFNTILPGGTKSLKRIERELKTLEAKIIVVGGKVLGLGSDVQPSKAIIDAFASKNRLLEEITLLEGERQRFIDNIRSICRIVPEASAVDGISPEIAELKKKNEFLMMIGENPEDNEDDEEDDEEDDFEEDDEEQEE